MAQPEFNEMTIKELRHILKRLDELEQERLKLLASINDPKSGDTRRQIDQYNTCIKMIRSFERLTV